MDPILILIALAAVATYMVGVHAAFYVMRLGQGWPAPFTLLAGLLSGVLIAIAVFTVAGRGFA